MDLQVNLVRARPTARSCSAGAAAVSARDARNRVIWNGARRRPRPAGGPLRLPAVSARGAADRGRPRRARRAGDESVSVYGHMFPVRGTHDFGGSGARFGAGPLRPLAPGPGRVRRLRHAAGRRPRRQGEVRRLPLRRRLLRRDRRQGHRRRLRLHAPAPAGARAGRRPRLHRPGAGRGRRDRQRRAAATSTSRSGPRPAGTTAAARSTRCPTCKRWDRTASRDRRRGTRRSASAAAAGTRPATSRVSAPHGCRRRQAAECELVLVRDAVSAPASARSSRRAPMTADERRPRRCRRRTSPTVQCDGVDDQERHGSNVTSSIRIRSSLLRYSADCDTSLVPANCEVTPERPSTPTRSCWAASRRCRARPGSRAGSR